MKEETGANASRNTLQIVSLLDTLEFYKVDAAMGGARRDEEKAVLKNVFFHIEMNLVNGTPNQRPELWNLFNGRKNFGEHFRVFPISNWTEMDVWEYIKLENIELPSLYFSHNRSCVIRDGVILANSEYIKLKPGEKVINMRVRFRTCGDMPITGAVYSEADTVEKIIAEIATTITTERVPGPTIKEVKQRKTAKKQVTSKIILKYRLKWISKIRSYSSYYSRKC